MRGKVVWYEPVGGRAVIETDDGRELAVQNLTPAAELSGWDLVELQDDTEDTPAKAKAVRVLSRWADQLNSQHRPLVNEFHALIRIEPA